MKTLFTMALVCLLATGGWAGAAQRITWKELAPKTGDISNPYLGLSADETHLLGVLVDVYEARAAGGMLSEDALMAEEIALAALNSIGHDGEALVLAVKEFGDQLVENRVTLNQDLIGEKVEIPGYALPLEFDGMKVTEFLLVPYAGACIHTPPPPSNQIIYIRSPQGFEMRGLFEPVVAQGILSANGESMAVGLSDGSAEFPVGYEMTARSITPYQ